MFQSRDKKEEQVNSLKDIIQSTSGETKAQHAKENILILGYKEQMVVYDLVRSMNMGKDGPPMMRVELAIQQMEKMKEKGLDINIIVSCLTKSD